MKPEAAADLQTSSDKTLMEKELLHVDKQRKCFLVMGHPPGDGMGLLWKQQQLYITLVPSS